LAKDFAVYLLRAGAEIEHSLAVQYLYAAYSIDETNDKIENNAALTWKRDLRLIAREEMAHLITVQNLLRALGQEPHLNRGPVHRDESKLPLPFKLERLGKTSLGKFVMFESPQLSQVAKPDRRILRSIRKELGNSARVLRVGSIYAALYWLFAIDDTPDSSWPFSKREEREFLTAYGPGYHIGPEDFTCVGVYDDKAATAEEWGIFEDTTHVDGGSPRQTALASLLWIMSQGEGPNAIEDSHFYRFLAIYKSFEKVTKKSKSLIMHVPKNPRVLADQGSAGPGVETGTLILNRGTERWGALFNLRYQFMLLNILESLGESRKTMLEKRRVLARWAAVEMEFMKKIGQALPRMDLRPQKKKPNGSNRKNRGPVAGAPFQAVFLPATSSERKCLRRELLDRSGGYVSDLRSAKPNTSTYTGDSPTAAVVPSLLDAIARQDDEMRRAFE
jgi:hypothetical protein